MLCELTIKNFAIIADLSLEIDKGMTVFTGETGAGKSICLEALGFALGSRSDASVIRHDQEQAEVSASFELPTHHPARYWLSEKSLGNHKDCIVRRIIKITGRAKCYINDHPVTRQKLSEFGSLLMDFHGQHEHYSLIKDDAQRTLLDDFAQSGQLLTELNQLYSDYNHCSGQLRLACTTNEEVSARKSLLEYQLAELEQLAPEAKEYKAICDEHTQLANADILKQQLLQCSQQLYDDNMHSAYNILATALKEIKPLVSFDSRLNNIVETLNTVKIYLQESKHELANVTEQTQNDPERLHELDRRLSDYQEIARKHRVEPSDLHLHFERLQQEFNKLTAQSQDPSILQQQLAEITSNYHEKATLLSARRQAAALKLEQKITYQLGKLNMKGAKFHITVTSEDDKVSALGRDKVTFKISANTGSAPLPIAKIASGGELSRISLAVQVISARNQNSQTLVFDEVDVGIGGATAEVVGKLLKQLSTHAQVLCVTHQGQVAAQADQHIKIAKRKLGKSTCSRASYLDGEQRVLELARMIGGLNLTETTHEHAQELLLQARA